MLQIKYDEAILIYQSLQNSCIFGKEELIDKLEHYIFQFDPTFILKMRIEESRN